MWVLVIEDEPAMSRLLQKGLEEDNHTVTLTRDGLEGVQVSEMCEIDAIVLDVMLPGLNGIDVARRLRSAGRRVPILMLTARDAVADIIQGLEAGADDYLTKPFSFEVLLARLRALSRRAVPSGRGSLVGGDVSIDPITRQVTCAGQRVDLTTTEYRVLEFLLRRVGQACSRAAIIDGVWGLERQVRINTLEAFISILRNKLAGADGACIETIRGYGYIVRDEP